MHLKFAFAILLTISLLHNSLIAGNNFFNSHKDAQNAIYSLQFNKAESLLTNSKQDFYSNFLLVKTLFAKNIIIGGKNNYEKFNDKYDNAFKLIKKNAADSIKDALLSELLIEKSVIELLNRNFITGAYDFIKSYSFFEDSQNDYPNLKYALKLKSLFKIIAGVTPEKGQSFLKLIGLKADVKTGVQIFDYYLNYAKNQTALLPEAIVIDALIKAYLKDDTGVENKINIEEKMPENNLYVFSKALIFFKENNYKKSQEYINILFAKQTDTIPFLYYLSGVNKTVFDNATAKKYLLKFLQTSKSKHFIKASYWQLARISALNNDAKSFAKYRQLTINKGSEFTEADKSAMIEAEENSVLNKNLLKARLLFDAGEFKLALQTLISTETKKSIKTTEEKARFFYRFARIKDKLNDKNTALKYYLKVCNNFRQIPKYYVPYSAFLAGAIYEENKNIDKAKQYYNLALQLNNNNYRNSLQHKIKSRLKNLDN